MPHRDLMKPKLRSSYKIVSSSCQLNRSSALQYHYILFLMASSARYAGLRPEYVLESILTVFVIKLLEKRNVRH
jgi:hypothetical protein